MLSSVARQLLTLEQRKFAKFGILKAKQLMGYQPSLALNGLDKAIDRHLATSTRPPGFFIEAGGNDGISQSNTYHLETYLGWSGMLIEPIPWLSKLARRFRKCEVIETALGADDADGGHLTIIEDDLVSTAESSRAQSSERKVLVPVRSLNSLLNERQIRTVDLFSLDVEGFESEVLKGVNFHTFDIKALLVETKALERLPIPWSLYQEPIKLSFHDYLILKK